MKPMPTYSPFPTEKFDLPVRDKGRPELVYAVASTERSGSTLLCRIMAETGLLGLPANYLHIEWQREILRRGDKGLDLLNILYRLRTTPNGCFGIKFHHPTKDISHPAFNGFEPDQWVFTRRHDKLAQAISWSIATQTNSWWSEAPEQWEASYDFNNILTIAGAIVLEDSLWEQRLEQCNVPVHEIWYGSHGIDTLGTKMVELMKPPMDEPYKFEFPELKRQRTKRSQEWAAKFLYECGTYNIAVPGHWGSDLL